MTFFLDTNICIYHLNGSAQGISRMLEKTPFRSVKIPSMVAAELLYGAEKSAKREYDLNIFKTFLSLYDIVPFDQKAIEYYAAIRKTLESTGKIIGGNDLVIAATVMANGGTLVTRNIDEFSRIEGLLVSDWGKESE